MEGGKKALICGGMWHCVWPSTWVVVVVLSLVGSLCHLISSSISHLSISISSPLSSYLLTLHLHTFYLPPPHLPALCLTCLFPLCTPCTACTHLHAYIMGHGIYPTACLCCTHFLHCSCMLPLRKAGRRRHGISLLWGEKTLIYLYLPW